MHCLSLSVFCRLLRSREINKDKLFKFWRLYRAAFKVTFFLCSIFFYLEKVSFLLEQTSEKHSAWYLLFLLIFISSVVGFQEIKVPVLRPEGLWCLEGKKGLVRGLLFFEFRASPLHLAISSENAHASFLKAIWTQKKSSLWHIDEFIPSQHHR